MSDIDEEMKGLFLNAKMLVEAINKLKQTALIPEGQQQAKLKEVSSEGYAKISNADIWWGKIGGGK